MSFGWMARTTVPTGISLVSPFAVLITSVSAWKRSRIRESSAASRS